MRLLLLEEVEDGLAHRAHRVARVEHVDDDVGRVEDLVELAPDAPRLALGVDALARLVARVVGAARAEQLGDGDCRGRRPGSAFSAKEEVRDRRRGEANLPSVDFSSPSSAISSLSGAAASSSNEPTSRWGRLRWALEPNVLENGSVSTMCGR